MSFELPDRLVDQVEKVRDRTAEAVGSDGGSVLREVGRLARHLDRFESTVTDRLDGIGAAIAEADDRLDDLHAESVATTWPRRLFWLLVGAGAGAAVAYFADPDRGQVRREEVKDQAASRAREVRDEVVTRAEDVKDQVVASAGSVRAEAEHAAEDVAAEARAAAQDVAAEAQRAAADVRDQAQDSAQHVVDEARPER